MPASDHVVATARAHLGCAHYFAGRLDEAEADLRKAVATLDKVGDWFGGFAHHFLRHVHARPRRHPEGVGRGGIRDRQRHGARRPGDDRLGQVRQGPCPRQAGRAHGGRDARRRARSSRCRPDSTTIGIAYGVLGFVRLQASDYAGARDRARAISGRDLSGPSCLIEFVGPTFPLLVESLLGPRWADAEGGPSRALARKAWRESRFARFIGWRLPELPPARPARQRPRRVRPRQDEDRPRDTWSGRSLAAEKLGARYDLARALLDASLVIPDKADDYRRRGQQLLDELGAVVPEAERLP